MEGAVEFSTNMQHTDANDGRDLMQTVAGSGVCTQEKSEVSGSGVERDRNSMEIEEDTERNLGKRSSEEATGGPTEKSLKVGSTTKGIINMKEQKNKGTIAKFLVTKTSKEIAAETPNKLMKSVIQ